MCIFKQPKQNKVVNQNVPEPEKTAEPSQVGSARDQEDQDLFGGVPDLRVDRSTTGTNTTAGSGLNLM
jgi:hypothetical protein